MNTSINKNILLFVIAVNLIVDKSVVKSYLDFLLHYYSYY